MTSAGAADLAPAAASVAGWSASVVL